MVLRNWTRGSIGRRSAVTGSLSVCAELYTLDLTGARRHPACIVCQTVARLVRSAMLRNAAGRAGRPWCEVY